MGGTLETHRAALADAIRAAVPDANVYPHVPAVPSAPAIVLVPDEPWLALERIGRAPVRVRARFRVHAMVADGDNAGSLDRLERLVVAMLVGLPGGLGVGEASRPGRTTVGSSDLLVTDLLVELPVELDAAPLDPTTPED